MSFVKCMFTNIYNLDNGSDLVISFLLFHEQWHCHRTLEINIYYRYNQIKQVTPVDIFKFADKSITLLKLSESCFLLHDENSILLKYEENIYPVKCAILDKLISLACKMANKHSIHRLREIKKMLIIQNIIDNNVDYFKNKEILKKINDIYQWNNKTALYYAIEHKKYDIVAILLQNKIPVYEHDLECASSDFTIKQMLYNAPQTPQHIKQLIESELFINNKRKAEDELEGFVNKK